MSDGAEHEIFAKDVGTWDTTSEVRPQPGAPANVSKGTSTGRIVGGRWLVTDFENESGFAGHGVYGWDASRKRYVGTWVDTMRSFMSIAEGTWDAATRTMTFLNEATFGGRVVRWRETTTQVDDDTQVFRSFMPLPSGDGEFEMMTVTYRRRR